MYIFMYFYAHRIIHYMGSLHYCSSIKQGSSSGLSKVSLDCSAIKMKLN